MSYSKAQIADLCTRVTSGGTPLTSVPAYYDPKEIPWLKTGEVNYCRIYDTESYISKEGLAHSSAKMIPADSVVVAMYGQGDTAGRVAINKIPLSTNQACCNLVINHEIADYEYVYYALCTLYDHLVALKNGGAQPNLNAKKIKAIEIPFPDLEIQRKIASVLGAYDALIENNQKQIKLLEEAAQRLYKEWFVNLRFPGYEDTPIIDGVPEGWHYKQICSIADIKAGGDKPEIVNNYKSENTLFPIYANGIEHDGLYGYTTKPVIEKESVTISARGTVGFVFLRRTPYVPIVRLLSVIPHTIPAIYMYYCLKNETFERNGTSQQQITVPMVKNKELLIADISTVDKFTSKATELHDKTDILKTQIELLTEARDRLLPKLMSGEIEV